MNDEDLIRLQHMLDYTREARVFATGHKQTDLNHDRALMHILIRLVEVIGEAASKVSRETRDQLPRFEWQDIIGMRNKLIHVYHNINIIPEDINDIDFKRIKLKDQGKISSEQEENELFPTSSEKRFMTAKDLLDSGLVGIWKDRDDIKDSACTSAKRVSSKTMEISNEKSKSNSPKNSRNEL